MRAASLYVLTALAAAEMATASVDVDDHEVGPGVKKTVRGVRLDVPTPKAKPKSESLKRLLRK